MLTVLFLWNNEWQLRNFTTSCLCFNSLSLRRVFAYGWAVENVSQEQWSPANPSAHHSTAQHHECWAFHLEIQLNGDWRVRRHYRLESRDNRRSRLIKAPCLSFRDLYKGVHAVFKLPPWYLTWGIIGSRHRVVDECVSVKQSHSNGHRPLTGDQAPLLPDAIMMQSR